eukprot:CAMPEP_0119322312 /NCGR_PEP_ID=MMETSP1333-20130426/57806_1 /TAXON_ID=418940 /ORGANISM="Scyphosphaera apsteinii, Strain RCC1455" /LENGTH=256 /DNA_ID=CAMNT_0007329507 /DNA_START=16 /DNA_END=786 /DNA_ORIENTATION=+
MLEVLVGSCLAFATIHSVGYYAVAAYFRGVEHVKYQNSLAAHTLTTFIAFMALSGAGVLFWLVIPDTSIAAEQPLRTQGYSTNSDVIASVMVAFQIYEIACAITVPRLRGRGNQHLIHHLSALLVAALGVGFVYLHYYAPFYMGFVELSSVPLCIMDCFKEFPALKQLFPELNEMARVVFAVLFLAVRVCYWPVVSFSFWVDSLAELQADGAKPAAVVYAFCVSNFILTLLQFFWGSLVLRGMFKKLTGAPPGKED